MARLRFFVTFYSDLRSLFRLARSLLFVCQSTPWVLPPESLEILAQSLWVSAWPRSPG